MQEIKCVGGILNGKWFKVTREEMTTRSFNSKGTKVEEYTIAYVQTSEHTAIAFAYLSSMGLHGAMRYLVENH